MAFLFLFRQPLTGLFDRPFPSNIEYLDISVRPVRQCALEGFLIFGQVVVF
jgi:hypothetical protein